MDIIEGVVKIKYKKQWKKRWCKLVLQTQDDGMNMLIATVFKYLNDSQPAESLTHPAKRLTLPNLCGLHSGFLLDKEQNTLALIGSDDAFIFSFNDEVTLQDWINSIKSLADLGNCFDMFMVEAPKSFKKLSAHFVKLYMLGDYLCMICLSPVRYITSWKLSSLLEFGIRDGDRFFLKGPTATHKDSGEFVFQSTASVDLARAMTNRRSELQDGSSSSGTDSHTASVSSHRSTQHLNFYEDFYLRNMRRNSVASVQSSTISEVIPEQSRTAAVINPAIKSLVTSPRRYVPQQCGIRTQNSSLGLYDVPPNRQALSNKNKCGIYDVPPCRTSEKKVNTNANGLYDKLPPTRRISSPALSSLVTLKAPVTDASPKTKADFNSALQYVDLSQYDGYTKNDTKNHSQKVFNRSKSLDADCIYDTPPPRPKRTDLHNQQDYQNINSLSLPVPPQSNYDILPPMRQDKRKYSTPVIQSHSLDNLDNREGKTGSNLSEMRHLAKSADNIRIFGKQRLSLATQPLQLSPTNDLSELPDDGYVLVSEQVITRPHSNHVKMRSKSRRQYSLDITGYRCSTDSGRMTSSNTSLSSRRRESCSSLSGSSHVSLASPNRLQVPSTPTSQKDFESSSISSCTQDYMNIYNPNSLLSRTISETSIGEVKAPSPCFNSDINYADLELDLCTTQAPSKPSRQTFKEKTTTQLPKARKSDIEYVMINIMATEALRKASEEHKQYRNRERENSKEGTTPVVSQ